MALAYLGLGSNLGDRESHLQQAIAALSAVPEISDLAVSGFHETDPVGPQDQGPFLNAAVRIETSLPPRQLLDRLLAIEERLGRLPREERRHWGPREIDLDLLIYDEKIIGEPGLTVPHPHLHERTFVLRPLAELSADLRHPVLRWTVAQLLVEAEAACPTAEVARL